MQTLFNRKRILSISIIVGGLSLFVWLFNGLFNGLSRFSQNVSGPSFVYSTDTSFVDITLEDSLNKASLKLQIPKAYLTNSLNWGGGDQEFVEIQATMPGLEALGVAAQKRKKNGTSDSEKPPDKIYIQLNAGFGKSSRAKNYFRVSGYKTKLENQYQLERYQRIDCPGQKVPDIKEADPENECTIVGSEELYLTMREDRDLAFECGLERYHKDPSCRAFATYRNRSLKYVFKRSNLPNWEKIDIKVRALLDGFFVSDIQPEPKKRPYQK